MTRVSVRSIRRNDVAPLCRLVQLYLYDLGGHHWNVEANGSFGSPAWHRYFWRRRGRRHFVIRVGGKLAGFALVSNHAHFAGKDVREINDFFVLRKYRDRGVGTYAARMLLARFPGRWEVSEITWNVAARRFWRRLIQRCAVDGFVERRRRHGALGFFVQHFTTAKRKR